MTSFPGNICATLRYEKQRVNTTLCFSILIIYN
nr:MAG TPA: hypothetical protein [Caudoviricetes sp.]